MIASCSIIYRQEAKWRRTTATDLDAVERISNLAHPDLSESPAIFAEKLSLFPEGSFVLVTDDTLWGYAFVHPWRLFEIPKLNHLLWCLPSAPDCMLIHDVAVLAPARGQGASKSLLKLVASLAKERSLSYLALVSVYNSHLHWARHGFEVITSDTTVDKLKSYGETARYMGRRLD
jgi:GNAT superfamily N-acetyltransferase